MKKVLIIGGAGFVGGYLSEILINNNFEVHSTCLPSEKIVNNKCISHSLDILDKTSVLELLNDIEPDIIYHLAAQSSVALSWKNPQLTIDVNIKGAINVLDALKESSKSDARIILIGSGEEYGYIREDACPILEDEAVNPGNIYALTKAFQSMAGKIYARAYNMDIIIVRAFNHIGAGQLPAFVVSDFCKQVAEIEKGLKSPEIFVGNLDARRDFTDVRDVVRAYMMLGEYGKTGELYNVGSGNSIAIKDILDIVVSHSTVDIRITVDKNKLRPSDIPVIEADISKIKSHTGWTPEIPIEMTIKSTLDYWRNNI
ncbi:MAG: GDP-mannose 4,6-dehydratase [Oscillospiraceae bacterium]|nr:GDP-mannose 4,6-dehydratase [Oscillospiraceae bacterium]